VRFAAVNQPCRQKHQSLALERIRFKRSNTRWISVCFSSMPSSHSTYVNSRCASFPLVVLICPSSFFVFLLSVTTYFPSKDSEGISACFPSEIVVLPSFSLELFCARFSAVRHSVRSSKRTMPLLRSNWSLATVTAVLYYLFGQRGKRRYLELKHLD